MTRIKELLPPPSLIAHLVRWTLLVIPIGVVIGSVVALFLWLLPLAGIGIVLLYKKLGRNSDKGNNLLLDEIHEPGGGIPFRMAPLVLFGTVVTHLFGGSAGREGTAVQMGGSIAHLFGKWFRLRNGDMSIILTAGIAAGFGAVFGTPLAGAIFALEVLAIGHMKYDALLPCLIAGLTGDVTCSLWGIHHTQYHILFAPGGLPLFKGILHIDLLLLVKVIMAGVAFGLAGLLFAETTHGLKRRLSKAIHPFWLMPVIGGGAVIALTWLLGTTDFLGLGVLSKDPHAVTIVSAFSAGGAHTWSWLWKLLFTAITLSTGFKGGEVTPLFFIGAALGNTLAVLLGAPVDLFAGLGFIAVFAGASNTPLACTIMGVELFGGEHTMYYAVACFTAYFFSGMSGIYSSQRTGVPKMP